MPVDERAVDVAGAGALDDDPARAAVEVPVDDAGVDAGVRLHLRDPRLDGLAVGRRRRCASAEAPGERNVSSADVSVFVTQRA